jgi:methyl-accepting chemotaxis protein
LRADIGGVVEQMRSGAETTGQGRSAMVDLIQRLDVIGENVGGVAGRVGEIASIMGRQTMAAEEVAESTAAIADLARRNDERVREAMATMEQIANALDARVGEMAKLGSSMSVLIVAKNDHVMFKRRILDAVMGHRSMREDEAVDHTQCRLGKWLAGLPKDDSLAMPSLGRLEEPHRGVHKAGRDALAALHRSDRAAALAAVDEMNAASRLVLGCLDAAMAEWNAAARSA